MSREKIEEIIEIEKEAVDSLKVSLKNIYDIFNRHFYEENEPTELPPNQWIGKLKEIDENINMELVSNENGNDIYDETHDYVEEVRI